MYGIFVVNHLVWAEQYGVQCFVDFGSQGADGRDNPYFSEAVGDNMWEYYFHPITDIAYRDLQHGEIVSFSMAGLEYLHEHCPDSVFFYPHGMHVPKRTRPFDREWFYQNRATASRLINSHI